MNRLNLVGKIVRAWEVAKTPNGTDVATCRLMVRKPWNGQAGYDGEQKNDYFTVKLYGQRAQRISDLCGEGDVVGVSGSINVYKKDTSTIVWVTADDIHLLPRPGTSDIPESRQQKKRPTQQTMIDDSYDPFAE